MTPEICICAAIRMPDGEVIRGHRHNNCYDVVRARINASMSPEVADEKRLQIVRADQGFVTSLNRFVDRGEAMLLQRAAGIPSARGDGVHRSNELFSEDLY